MLSEDRQLLGAAIRSALKDADVAYVVIRGANGTVIADSGKPPAELARQAPLPDHALYRAFDQSGTQLIEFVTPIVPQDTAMAEGLVIEAALRTRPGAPERQTIGSVTVGLSMASVERRGRAYLELWAGITVGFLIVSTGAIYAFARRITRPVNRLTEHAQKVAAGVLGQHIDIHSRDEIGRLATAFVEMTQSLEHTIGDKERLLAELQELNRTLEDRISDRTAELEAQSRALAMASRHKSDFLANVSHELRTPLNAILGFNELIIGGLYGAVPPDVMRPLQDIQSSGGHLLRLINDVLDLSKIESGRMELALTDYAVEDVVGTVVTSLRPLAVEKGLQLIVSLPDDLPLAHGDSKRVTQCLMNLAGNAVKFTREGRVTISAARAADAVVYQVSDTGIGITKANLEQLFTEFRQADPSITHEFGGTGLGLSITKKFVEMDGGWISVESEPGKGSTFSFSIPLRVESVGPA